MLDRSYPDDLDDTACAVSAILAHNPGLITPTAQAHIAQNLISCETQIGGPYTTWLVPKNSAVWADIDIAVNANIGHMLSGLGVKSEALEKYIGSSLLSDDLVSPYYVGIVPTLYFLARWYSGPSADILHSKIIEELTKSKSVLHTAMLISSAIRQGLGRAELQTKIDYLVSVGHGGSWPAEALYFEPPQGGQIRYAGSAELTTAFVIEALNEWVAEKSVYVPQQNTLEIDDMAGVFAMAGNWRISSQVIKSLNTANKLGWQAYTIYDDFLDNEGQPADLPQANQAHRQAVRLFKLALNNNQQFNDYMDEVFDIMDDANYWEIINARDVGSLPNYGDLSQMSNRSWGQSIAPVGVMLAAGFAMDSPEVKSIQKFMKHYIIAKQLSDDAHDWQVDLENGHMTVVVCMLLQDCPQGDINKLSEYFWNRTILEVNKHIRQQLKMAKVALGACNFHDDLVFRQWLSRLEASCVKSEQGRVSALEFIQEFSRLALV